MFVVYHEQVFITKFSYKSMNEILCKISEFKTDNLYSPFDK